MTPLHLAVQNCDEKLVNSLLSKDKTNVNIQETYEGRTPLHCVENEETLQELLQRPDLNVNIQDHRGDTALHNFCSCENYEGENFNGEPLVEMLLEQYSSHVDTWLQNKNGDTPFETAVTRICTDKYIPEFNFFNIQQLIKNYRQKNDKN